MKISKKKQSATKSSVIASTQIAPASNNYSEAEQYIQSAMAVLSESAKSDPVAKNAIVDLSVVLFSLRAEA